MFCSKTNNNLINRTHKRALRIVYSDHNRSLEELLLLDKNCTVHIRNLRYLMCEIYKSINKINPDFMWELFKIKSTSMQLRAKRIIHLPSRNSLSKGTNTNHYRSITLWNSLNPKLMEAKSLDLFKKGLTTWEGKKCVCKICKI